MRLGRLHFDVVGSPRGKNPPSAVPPSALYHPSGFSTPLHIFLIPDHFSRTATGPTAYTNGSMSQKLSDPEKIKIAGGIEYIYWLALLGKSRSTGWRWRRAGPKGEAPRVRCCRIDNTLYISYQEIRRFWRRAEAGEFEGQPGGICAPKAT